MIPREISVAASGSVIKAVWVFLFFAIAARQLDVEQFADFSFWLTVSIVLGLLFDFGQQTALLTRSARHLRLAFSYVRFKLGLTLVLAVVMAIGGVVLAAVVGASSSQICYGSIAIGSGVAGSIGILYCIPHRAGRKYGADVVVATTELFTALAGAGLAASMALPSGLAFLSAYGIARLAGAVVATQMSPVGLSGWLSPRMPRRAHLRFWSPFFIHLLFGTLILNIDLLIGRFSMSTMDYAVYQTGMRIVQAGNLILTVISNVYLPRWTQTDKLLGYDETNKQLKRLSLLTVTTSLGGVLLFLWFGHDLAVLLFGANYRSLGDYLPYFGLLLGIRLAAAFLGVMLSSRHAQWYRTKSAVIGVTIITILLVPWFGSYGAGYVVTVQLIAHVAMSLYLLAAARKVWRP